MRLLSYDGHGYLRIDQFFVNVPPYAILSHTWGLDEVTFDDVIGGTYQNKAGYAKINFCGRQAKRYGLNFFWVDTCCIKKYISGEVSEAINSMFAWYRDSEICFVYLSDISSAAGRSDFMISRWHTRSWTLQELLAPKKVQFFSSDGQCLGDKTTLAQAICGATGVPIQALQGSPLSTFSMAECMSWAESREATRGEDRAYSLLGIFDVSMPLLYGEGHAHAFRRLQEGIRGRLLVSRDSNPYGMRLLVANSDPPYLKTVPTTDGLQYAILSHTWGEDEVLFDHMRSATYEQKRSFSKIRKCCELAVSDGFDYVWADTCCIDKSSSSELQEAICSMYKWYQNAAVCYVYLADYWSGYTDSLMNCRWFKRGWTLQELIAPDSVVFYDQDWNEIGSKQSLCDEIARITSIDPLVLRGANPTKRTVAERMSWAASRSTERLEDAAYSLMGLFDVFMPMLYGEGDRAFIRLQEEIIKQTEDYTIFSWRATASDAAHRGIFAHSPAEFSVVKSHQVIPRNDLSEYQPDQHPPPVLTSRGLVLTLPMMSCDSDSETSLAWVSDSCYQEDSAHGTNSLLCITLRQIQSRPPIFVRCDADKLTSHALTNSHHFKPRAVCVLPSTVQQLVHAKVRRRGEVEISVPTDNNEEKPQLQMHVANWGKEEDGRIKYSPTGESSALGAIRFDLGVSFVVVIGFHEDRPWCSIVTIEDAHQQQKALENMDHLQSFARSTAEFTDRARRTTLDETTTVSAAMRVARSSNEGIAKFRLHVSTC